MPSGAPFDVWDGEGLDREESPRAMPPVERAGSTDLYADDSVEEVAMHLDPESEAAPPPDHAWAALDGADGPTDDGAPPARYFPDEQPDLPEGGAEEAVEDDRRVNLEVLLERQHYAFPPPKS